jgi:hypothetical protein
MFEGLSGAGLATALAGVEVGPLDADAALDYALAAARLTGWAAAAEAAGLARLQQTYPAFESTVDRDVHQLDTGRLVVHEVRAAYGCSQLAASAKLGFAGFLRDIPAVADALATGAIRVEHARLLDRETAALGAGSAVRAAVVEELLAAHAATVENAGSGWTLRQWSLRTARTVLQADPSRAEQAAAETRAGRRVWHAADTGHAQGSFGMVGPVADTAACQAAVALLTGVDQQPASGTGLVGQVTVPLSSLVGVDDAPGELAGVGPIPAGVARELMANAGLWRRILTDLVDGHVVTQHIKTYRPSAAMRRFVLTRTGGVCSARGCGARHGLQLDHVIPSPDGPTSVTNFAPQCPPDHNGKPTAGGCTSSTRSPGR